MARNRIAWQSCGCCQYTYNDVEVAKGSHYEIGDDDDAPYKHRKKKEKTKKVKPYNKCRDSKNHVFVWVKIMQQNYREEMSRFNWATMYPVRYAEPGEFVNRYDFMCVGCGAVRKTTFPRPAGRRWWSYEPVPADHDVYEVRHLDKNDNLR